MPQGVVQELSRILSSMQEQGIKCAWLSEENRQVLAHAGRPVQSQLPVKPAPPAPVPARPSSVRPQTQPVPESSDRQVTSIPQPSPTSALPAIHADELAGLANLKELLAHCQHLLPANARLVAPQGQSQARLVFVGDYPNADESLAGKLLVGKAGTMLRKMAEAMGLHWQEGSPDTATYATTVLKYRPSAMPSDDELKGWLPILRREIELVKPQALVLLGGMTANLLLEGQPPFSKICGTIQKYREWPTLVIQNPVQIIRFESLPEQFIAERKRAWIALQQMMSLLGLSRPK